MVSAVSASARFLTACVCVACICQDFQGWKELGVPVKICLEDGEQLPMTDAINEHLETGAHVFITPSLKKRPLPSS